MGPISAVYEPYISPMSALYEPYISPMSALCRPYMSPSYNASFPLKQQPGPSEGTCPDKRGVSENIFQVPTLARNSMALSKETPILPNCTKKSEILSLRSLMKEHF